MRILIATSHGSLVGGVEKYLQTLIPGMRNRGHEIGLIHENPAGGTGETIDPPPPSLASWCLAELGPEATLRIVAEWKPDVVYSHGLQDAGFEQSLLAGYPSALYAHNYFGTCPTGQKCHSLPSPRPCSRRSGPMCLVLHYPRRCGGLNPFTMWRMYQRNAQLQGRLQDYEAILVASRHMFREYERQGVNSSKLHFVPLPTGDGSPQPDPPAAHAPRNRILLVGRLTRLKGGSHLIHAIPKAAAKLGRPLTLAVAGDGPERGRLESLAHRLGVRATFAGWVDDERRREMMRQADLLAVPSVWPEPFGLVGVEAGALGLPAVGYAVGGIPEWLIPGHSGELAPGDPPTVDGLADAIVRAVADPAHYAKLCRGAWETSGASTLRAHLERLEPILEGARRRGTASPCLAGPRAV